MIYNWYRTRRIYHVFLFMTSNGKTKFVRLAPQTLFHLTLARNRVIEVISDKLRLDLLHGTECGESGLSVNTLWRCITDYRKTLNCDSKRKKSHVVTLVIFWLFLKGWHMKYHRKASFDSLFLARFGLMQPKATNHKLFLMSEFGAAGCNGTSPSYREQYPFVRPQKWNQGALQRQRTGFFLSVTARPARSQWVNSHFCSSTISPLSLTREIFFCQWRE